MSGYFLHCVSKRFQHEFPPIDPPTDAINDPVEMGKFFLKQLKEMDEKVQKLYKEKYTAEMKTFTDEDREKYENGTSCHICSKGFEANIDYREWLNLYKNNIISSKKIRKTNQK